MRLCHQNLPDCENIQEFNLYFPGGLKLSFSPLRAAIVSTGSKVPVWLCTEASPTWEGDQICTFLLPDPHPHEWVDGLLLLDGGGHGGQGWRKRPLFATPGYLVLNCLNKVFTRKRE